MFGTSSNMANLYRSLMRMGRVSINQLNGCRIVLVSSLWGMMQIVRHKCEGSNSGKPKEYYSYDELKRMADLLMDKSNTEPEIGIICGSGLGSLADSICHGISIDYKDIPDFPQTTVDGHKGSMVFGCLGGMPVMALQGRFHFYEGYSMATCTMPVRLMKLMGIKILMATNAAGGINPDYNIGDIMVIRDHVNFLGLAGQSPLRGKNDDKFGTRFPPLVNAYDPKLIAFAMNVAKEMGIQKEVRLGTYGCVSGPTYETIAEHRMLRTCHIDCVGMSTAHEVIVARHAGIKAFGFSLVSDKCVLNYEGGGKQSLHDEIVSVAGNRQGVCAEFLSRIVEKIADEENCE